VPSVRHALHDYALHTLQIYGGQLAEIMQLHELSMRALENVHSVAKSDGRRVFESGFVGLMLIHEMTENCKIQEFKLFMRALSLYNKI